MAPLTNGYTNGAARHLPTDPLQAAERFSDIPSTFDIYVGDAEEAVELNLDELNDDATELCTLLENENAEKRTWMVIALAYAKQKNVDQAIDILQKGLSSLSRGGNPKEKLGPWSLLCWMYLGKSRNAPRVAPEGSVPQEVKTKDDWLQAATAILNEASRVNPAFPPLYLARGVLYLLRAALQPPSKPVGPGSIDHSERHESLRQAQKCFEDSAKVSSGRNMMAVLGAARAQFSNGRYADALAKYQEVLLKMPQLRDPDPRIGIGCCLWQLNHKDEAKEAWERALEINPSSEIAMILTGLCYLEQSSHYNHKDPEFAPLYKRAMEKYTQAAYKLDKDQPLTCATFGGYFLLRKSWSQVAVLARKAIELTDVNAVASDGWYLLGRAEHSQEVPDLIKANDFYGRADAARGGGDRGYVPARFGLAQVQVLLQDLDGAKFRLEKLLQQSKSTEAMMLLGALHAEEVFANQASVTKEDKSAEAKKAIALLEAVRLSWKDPQRKLNPDTSVLIYLARLYELEQPDKALQCLQQVEKMNVEALLESEEKALDEMDEERLAKLREDLSPQLLNNLGCFQYHMDKFDQARNLFQTALGACVKIGQKDDTVDTDALVTSISFNLARTYEAAGLLDDAKKVYEGLLERHSDYTDARTRLAFIELRQNPTEDGPKAMAALNESDGGNLEVRAMLGWYLSRSKKKATNIADDQEQKHYKKTLLDFDKHDRFSLTGMGNLYQAYAREMRRMSDKEKEKRSNEYYKAVSYYDKVLQLDPKNAYAAQGIGIALVEDRKDLAGALQIFNKIRDTVKDSSVNVNLGHVFCELKQYTRAIENYEAALNKDRASDPQVLACLGRVYLLKGKQDKSSAAIKSSLDYSRRALAIAPSQIHFKFNIAFVQIQLAQLIHTMPETQRSLADVQAAAEGLEEAIESFTEIAQAKNPPYPKHDLEQRASMGRNTMRRQLERDTQQQREYEERNASRLEEARKSREVQLRQREEERLRAEEAAAEQKRKIAEERNEMLQLSRELAEKRAEEDRRREELEYTTDSETGEKVKRRKKAKAGGAGGGRRRKKDDDSGIDDDGVASDGAGGGENRVKRRKNRKSTTADNSAANSSDEKSQQPKKRRKLARKGGAQNDKYKSSEVVVDSDEDDDEVAAPAGNTTSAEVGDDDDGDEDGGVKINGRRRRRRSDDEVEDEDEDRDAEMGDAPVTPGGAAEEGGGGGGGGDGEDDDDDVPAVVRSHRRHGGANRRVADDEDEDMED